MSEEGWGEGQRHYKQPTKHGTIPLHPVPVTKIYPAQTVNSTDGEKPWTRWPPPLSLTPSNDASVTPSSLIPMNAASYFSNWFLGRNTDLGIAKNCSTFEILMLWSCPLHSYSPTVFLPLYVLFTSFRPPVHQMLPSPTSWLFRTVLEIEIYCKTHI